ncbi:hypothetical protein HRR83_009578 [Exophiala dermatitidis]|uniref:Retrograde regulation protein 2 n=1 Tax=Exophiala dermatitidis (strain ATCC 34100 / CBS 525.76 / NIH/UT8656) TaxID=858893 RepID=H6CBU0_EXODN|nr:retrograde regulation protein 2 [Exophiala dermatitidis NIH/UT8656]KAJ4501901.1 hypothetical protein HRR75_008834 [Exophiala dermatitidis]EHY61237.1 retrograde regulation protein 2 [Exophiala dermatitidis NIH/UT8656]KAJ4502172.1 hypothetical protein HRR73_009563 [Exophiala dermatitidis]KAJ4502307.1 hypothetical protein HRR74_009598 [Exophiala dermatitidis]KAJ4528881.1 hypothetical protein HRR76_009498 [Exophiala dermatitidis]
MAAMVTDDKASVAWEQHIQDVVEVQAWQMRTDEERRAEKRLLRKLDMVILPMMSISYLMAYLDRNNIGYARLMGLQEDLRITDGRFYNVIMVFYAGYLFCIFLGNISIRRFGPRVILGSAVVIFGAFVCGMSQAKSYATVIGLRFGVGAAEALLQASPLYMSVWYGRNELGKRVAIFYSSTTISGVFSGLISYGIQKNMEGTRGMASWQWLFLIEGAIAVAVGLVNATILPTFPDRLKSSRFLTDMEIRVGLQRSLEYNSAEVKIEPKQILQGLKDPKLYLLALLSGTNAMLLAATGAFLPSIVKEFGYSKLDAQLFTVIPYACSFCSMLAVGYLSDYYHSKSWFIISCLATAGAGLIILISTTGKEIGMFGACLLVAGTYPSAVLQITWIQITFCGATKRAFSWGFAMVIAQGMSMAASQIYSKPPRYFAGHGTLLGFVTLAIICTYAARVLMIRANKKKDDEVLEYQNRGDEHPEGGKSFEEVCDNHINFRYKL